MEKTFTQAQVNAIVASASAKLSARIEGLEREISNHETLKAELVAAAAALTSQVQSLTTERDTTAAAFEAAKAQHAQAVGAVRATTLQLQLSQALVAADAHPAAIPAALRELQAAAQLEADDAGNLTGIMLGGKRHDLGAGVRAFLEQNTFFAKGLAGGGGGARGHGATEAKPRTDNRSAADMVREGWETPPR
jgi:hypothetical protein